MWVWNRNEASQIAGGASALVSTYVPALILGFIMPQHLQITWNEARVDLWSGLRAGWPAICSLTGCEDCKIAT